MTWEEVCTHPALQDLPFKIEQDRYGRILMSPAATPHARRQGKLVVLLQRALGGEAFPEAPVETSDGVKVPDVVWMSAEFAAEHGSESPLKTAPEICVEVRSPSNAWAEMEEKVTLYLARGAQEVWICEADGRLRFFGHEGERERSALVPDAPAAVTL
jgi:Uma2 family endonuclease